MYANPPEEAWGGLVGKKKKGGERRRGRDEVTGEVGGLILPFQHQK